MKITAACAGLGATVGAALFAVLAFVVGPSVLAGLGTRGGGDAGLPRRYADYLRTGGGALSSLAVTPILPVAIGSGLVAGLLVGVVLQVLASRRASGFGPRGLVGILASSGLVVGTLLAVELHFYGRPEVTYHGRYVLLDGTTQPYFSSLDILGADASWWPLVVTGALVGLVVGVIAAAVARVLRRSRVRGSTSPSG